MGKMTLLLTREQVSALIEEAKRKRPVESCGLLFGRLTEREILIERIIPTRNVLESPTRFRISPEEFVEHLSKAEEEGLQLIGFYHSHPAAPRPSPIDLEYMKLWPQSVWLIVSSLDHSVAAYLVDDGKPVKIDIRLSKTRPAAHYQRAAAKKESPED
jgi:proteasome lid subunit RPN8/RPN11